MIRTQPQGITTQVDGHSGMGGLKVLSGNPVQTYNKDAGEYEPDRTLVPLLLMPWYNAADPDGLMTGEQDITGAEWYEGAPKEAGANRITAETPGYEISADGTPQWSLTVKKNVPADSPVELYCIYTLTNKKTGAEERHEASAVLRTSVFDSANFALRLTTPPARVLNPLDVEPAADGSWEVVYAAQLYNGTEAVPDANAVYWWQKKDKDTGQWRDFTEEETELYAAADGKTLTIDARLTEGVEAYRCRAAYHADGTPAPSAPPTSAWQAGASLRVQMPATLRVMQAQTAGMKMNAALSTPVRFEARLYYNRGEIGTGKDHLFLITWKARSGAPGSREVTLGTGRSVAFTPSSKGFNKAYAVSVWCEVLTYARHAVLVDSAGSTGAVLTDSAGAALIQPVYE